MRRKNFPSSATVSAIILATLSCYAGPARASAPSLTDQVKALRADYDRKDREAHEAFHAAKTEEEGARAYARKAPNPARYVEKFLDLAKPDPAAPGAFDALAAAVEFRDTAWDWKDESVSPDAAVDLLAAHHVENPRLAETFRYVKDSDSQASRNLMREAAKRNPDRSVRGQALFFLATGLTGQAELIELFRESPSFKEGLRKSHGEDWVARRSSADPKEPRDQARELFERAAKEFADVKVDDKTVGDLARQAFFQLDHLQVGQTAPEIVGKDADGVEMRLSDHRGKVVELVFWGGWCGSCMASVPEERNLVDKMRGRPFVLLGVNSDPPDRVNGIVREKRINWRSWADGALDGPQPIARAWNVHQWPEVYLLDASGVIRYNQLSHARADEVERAADALVTEAAHP